MAEQPTKWALERAYRVLVAIQEAQPITEGVEEDQRIVALALDEARRQGEADEHERVADLLIAARDLVSLALATREPTDD